MPLDQDIEQSHRVSDPALENNPKHDALHS